MMMRRHGAHLCFTPMLHAHLFVNDRTYRRTAFVTLAQSADRPLIVQFCANDPTTLLNACRYVNNLLAANRISVTYISSNISDYSMGIIGWH